MLNKIIAVFTIMFATSTLASDKTHYLVLQVNQNDPGVMNMALANAKNVTKYYEEKGENVVIEMVNSGPGIGMLIEGTSPVSGQIETMALSHPNVLFSACANTINYRESKTGQKITLIENVNVVPSGTVRIMELQTQGYLYVRP